MKEIPLERQAAAWEKERRELRGLPGGKGLNIAYEAVDRHLAGPLRDVVALRCVKPDLSCRDFTYQQLHILTSKFANILSQLGISKGERVFALTGRIPELYIAALGTLKQTAVFCPLFAAFGIEPLFQRLSRGDASLLVTTGQLFRQKVSSLVDRLPSLRYVLLTDTDHHVDEMVLSLPRLMEDAAEYFIIPPTAAEDPALLHFTSGTTGMPKGALHVHNAVFMHYITGKHVLGLAPGDVFWCTADPGWVTGTSYGIIAPLVNGVTNIVDQEEFDAHRWYTILEQQQVSVWYTAPTAIRRLMRMDIMPREKYHLEHLRYIFSVGEPLHADAVLWGQSHFGMPLRDNWWQTETGGIMIANDPSLPVKPGSMGRPLPGVEAAIAEIADDGIRIIEEPGKEGHLVLKKGWPSMFRAYLHDEERYRKCFRGDWYITGDLARCDADGYYWFVGRADDIIKTSGHMVGPFEVESTLMSHPAVAEAAVIGIPDPVVGEVVKAFIVLKPGFIWGAAMELDIIAFARRRLGPAIAPKMVARVEGLPKTRSGKILRRLLKARELGWAEGDTSTLEQS